MSSKELTEEEKRFLDAEFCIKRKDIIEYSPVNVPLPVGSTTWSKDNPPSQEYKEMLDKIVTLTRYIGMEISKGCPELEENMVKRCSTLSIIFDELIRSVAIDGWHLYGLTAELHNNVYMSLGGKEKVLELLQALSKFNEKKIMEKSRDYTQ
jgi:hypothetical protein